MHTTSTLPHPWTDSDIRRLADSQGFDDVGKALYDVASRLHRTAFMVSGPITSGGKGSTEENLAAYKRAIEHVRQKGHPVFNQFPGEEALRRHWLAWNQAHPGEGYCHELLTKVYLPIFNDRLVVGLFFMPGWQSSVGATWEHEQAVRLGFRREFLPDNWDAS